VAVKDVLGLDERSTRRLPVAAGLSLAFLFSALALHVVFFRRAKRDLGF
jgi:hypothetical protein